MGVEETRLERFPTVRATENAREWLLMQHHLRLADNPIMNGLTADRARAAYDTSCRALLSNCTEHYHYISPYLPGCPAVVPVASAGLKRFSRVRSSAGSM